MNIKFTKLLLLIVVSFLFTRCSTLPKTVYFQGDSSRIASLNILAQPETKIAERDILSVAISSLSEDINKLFEYPTSGGVRYSGFPNIQSSGMGMQPQGFEVNDHGVIDLPIVGKINVKGLSCSQAADTIRGLLNTTVKSPTVNVRILNHRFTVLGEINHPATYNLVVNTLSIPEALGMAGDLTIYGRRDNITLIREENGLRKLIKLNLLSKDILTSDYYYLKNGDILYIEPSSVKSTFNDRTYQMLPIITSVVSAVTSLGVLLLSLGR